MTLPAEPSATQKAGKARLEKLSGAAFDRAYVTDMVADHVKDVAEFQRASKTAKDPDLKAWAARTLPTLQDHLKSAKEVTPKRTGGLGRRRRRRNRGSRPGIILRWYRLGVLWPLRFRWC